MPMTCVFEMDVEKFASNPFHADTPFGRAIVVSKGDVCAESDKLREALEQIAALPGNPSDELATAVNIAYSALNPSP